jgi:iron(II)-dependent oxidoreductase
MTRREPRTTEELQAVLVDARARTLGLLEDLDDGQWLGTRLAIVNPPIWELGHVAWFQERWCLRHPGGLTSRLAGADALYDSAAIAHDTRWGLDFPDRRGTLDYVAGVLEAVLDGLAARAPSPGAFDLHLMSLFHEDMHGEAFVYTRQTHAYPPPSGARRHEPGGGPLPGDVELAGGSTWLGARANEGFAFDNEHDGHAVEVAPFTMARAPVTQAEFLAFVEDDGYARRELWTDEGWGWRSAAGAEHPLYWRLERPGDWSRRRYDAHVPLEPHLPVHHVNAFEAEAFCRWAGRRLPTEAEWEHAAGPGRFPWGDTDATPAHACLDLVTDEPCEVGAHALGDTPTGLRQMLGNVWEWTATPFRPYPGFRPGLYREYSEPWFENHRVLRGGAFATRARLLRNSWRNFYTPDRRDVLAGLRTCAR